LVQSFTGALATWGGSSIERVYLSPYRFVIVVG
jgi:hypothetical protein